MGGHLPFPPPFTSQSQQMGLANGSWRGNGGFHCGKGRKPMAGPFLGFYLGVSPSRSVESLRLGTHMGHFPSRCFQNHLNFKPLNRRFPPKNRPQRVSQLRVKLNPNERRFFILFQVFEPLPHFPKKGGGKESVPRLVGLKLAVL